MKSLDLGCGGSDDFEYKPPRGDVNCDLRKPSRKIEDFVMCDGEFLPFPSDFFDKVFLFDVIEHLGSPLRVLREIKRVLSREGVLELGTPNSLYLPKILRSIFRGEYVPHSDHSLTFGRAELRNLLVQAGYVPRISYATYCEPKQPLHYVIAIKVCPFPALKHRSLRVYALKEPPR